MFPTLPNRLLATLAIFIGAWVWVAAVAALTASDGSAGLTLMMAHGGPVAALLMVLLAGLPAIILGVVCSSVANPLCGLFTLATALWVLAAHGDPISAWVHRTDANLPGDYVKLAVEVVIWTALLVGFLFLVSAARPTVRAAIPFLAAEPHLGEELTLTRSWLPALVAGGVTALVGGILAYFLIRSPDKGQVIGGLMLAFMIGGLVGDLAAAFLFQKHPANPLGLVLAPAVVAIVAYLLTAAGYKSADEFLTAYFSLKTSGLAFALPIDYASAGVAGCALGAGWSQVILHGQETAKSEADVVKV